MMTDDNAAEKAWEDWSAAYLRDPGPLQKRSFVAGRASRDAEVAELREQLAKTGNMLRVKTDQADEQSRKLGQLAPELHLLREQLAEARATIEKVREHLTYCGVDVAASGATILAIDKVLHAKPLSAPSSTPEMPEWGDLIRAERQRQIAKGYDDAHDAEHGPDHLIVWAIEYIRRGERVKAAAILDSVRTVIGAPSSTERQRP